MLAKKAVGGRGPLLLLQQAVGEDDLDDRLDGVLAGPVALQTSLSAPEIARELYVSLNTVRTHMRHVYDKPGAHRRLEAINRARALGLLAPVPQRA